MKFPKRKNIRLKDYAYSENGAYFITICTHERKNIFSHVVGQGLAPAEIKLSSIGEIINNEILNLGDRFQNIKIDKYVIMPNHIHAIIIIQIKTAGASPCPTLSDIICAFKSLSTRKIHKTLNIDTNIFQRSFYDHVIRDETDYLKIWNYIDTNPHKWQEDKYYQ